MKAILVVDLESTCWATHTPPDGEISEIIEIGWAKYEFGGNVEDRGSIYVKPIDSKISQFCTDLTGITDDRVASAPTFEEACKQLRQLNSKSMLWGSWGEYDHSMFQRQCARTKVAYPFGSQHLNIKQMFRVLMGLKRGEGMAGALSMLGMPLLGRHHSGGDDAHNIALLLKWMYEEFDGRSA